MRFMKDKTNFALDTLDRLELLYYANEIMKQNKGDNRYLKLTKKILNDAKRANGNLYITLKMRRVLMGFIRPTFQEEFNKRNNINYIKEKNQTNVNLMLN